MALRWCAAGMLEADHQVRRANGHLHPAEASRRARSLPPQPGAPITVLRRVSCHGSLMVARQKIHAGMIHAGKTATVICEKNHFKGAHRRADRSGSAPHHY
jgi:hypothetical protein